MNRFSLGLLVFSDSLRFDQQRQMWPHRSGLSFLRSESAIFYSTSSLWTPLQALVGLQPLAKLLAVEHYFAQLG
jgi:hypothetical protein